MTIKNTKSFGARTTEEAHARLGKIAVQWGVSASIALSVLLEEVSEAEIKRIGEIIPERVGATPSRAKPTAADIRRYLSTLSPEERDNLMKGE